MNIVGEDEFSLHVMQPDGSVFQLPKQLAPPGMAPPQAPPPMQALPELGPAVNQPQPPPMPVPGNLDQAMGNIGEANRRVSEAQQFKAQADQHAAQAMPQQLHAQGLPTVDEGMAWNQQEMAANEAANAQKQLKLQGDAQLLRAEEQRYGDMRPETIVQRAPTWGKILMGIAMIAGGAAQGFVNPRGGNPFLKAIQNIIDDDVAGQERELARRGQALGAKKQNLREDMAGADKDFAQAELRRAKMWDMTKMRIDQVMAKTTSEQGKADLALAAAHAEKMAQDSYLKVATDRAEIKQRDDASKRSAWVQMEDTRAKERQHQQDILFKGTNMAVDADAKAKELAAKSTAGGGGFEVNWRGQVLAKTSDRIEARNTEKYLKQYHSTRRNLLEALKNAPGISAGGYIPLVGEAMSEHKQVANQHLNDAFLQYKELRNLGAALTKTEKGPLGKIIPESITPEFFGIGKNRELQVMEAIRMLDAEAEDVMGTLGVSGSNWKEPEPSASEVREVVGERLQ